VRPTWYLRRLRKMGVGEIVVRTRHAATRTAWSRQQVRPGAADRLPITRARRRFDATLPPDLRADAHAVRRLVAAADRLLAGTWSVFGSERTDMVDPDWSFDPTTGRHAPANESSFSVPYRDQERVGNVKVLWELSRHQHLTVLASAYWATGDERYAERTAAHLRSWWAANPYLTGVHWTSGIELGIRLISWVWVRRLLDGWDGAASLFEENPVCARQVSRHQQWLAAFVSRGSSANNHVVAEGAGLLVASIAFAWDERSERWERTARRLVEDELARNTFPSGLNREQASEYHGLVLELALAAAAEADRAGRPLSPSAWRMIASMLDALAAVVDTTGRPPRQGDADDGFGLIVDDAAWDRWASLLATGTAVIGRADWWPAIGDGPSDVRTTLLSAMTHRRVIEGRPIRRPFHFADAGLTLLRTATPAGELWVRCDGGPHGFLSIAAHAHADALSIEARVDGVDVLADPGTYCYHGEPAWRSYFRSTRAHNTVEVGGVDQSESGGPFLWMRHATGTVHVAETTCWEASHDGYQRFGVAHRRRVTTVPDGVSVLDVLTSVGERRAVSLAWHLGPDVDVSLDGAMAALRWSNGAATLRLPPELTWSATRGDPDAPLGWYSPGFGHRVPAWTLVGRGELDPARSRTLELVSDLAVRTSQH
jgi:hypothetical protein